MKRKHKLIIFIILVALLMSTTVFSVLHLRNLIEEDHLEMSKQLTNHTTTIFELWISDQVRFAKQISKNEVIIDLCLDPSDPVKQKMATAYLRDLQELYPYYENLPIAIKTDKPIIVETDYDRKEVHNGEFIVDTVSETTIGKGGESYSYIHEILDGKEYYISEIYRSIARGNPIIVISTPIKYNGEIIGISLVAPKMSYLTQFFVDSISIGDTGYMFVIDSANETIAHQNRNFILNDYENSHEIANYISTKIDEGNEFFEANIYNANKLYYGKKLNIDTENVENELYVIVTQNKTEIFRNVQIYALISIIGVVVISFLTYKTLILVNNNQLQQDKEKQLIVLNEQLETKVMERTAKLEDMSKRDGMTKLYNHEYIVTFLSSITNICSDENKLAVAIIDIDNFKKVNDLFGHQTGDLVIKTVARIIESNVRESDKVGRYGGEEYMIVLNNIDFSECKNIAERIRKEIENKTFTDINYSVTISIGLAKFKCESGESLIKRADTLMYQAKSNGKNQVVVDTE